MATQSAMVDQTNAEAVMNRQSVSPATEARAEEPEASGESVTLCVPFHPTRPPRRPVVRERPKPARPTEPFARISRILARAHHFQSLLDAGVVGSETELAALTKLSTARITQIMNLLVLAPDIQEEILFLPPVTKGQLPVSERVLRPLLKTLVWSEQRAMWAAIRDRMQPHQDATP
jgi:hypothetical protein